jgi:hypothetical protein
MTDTADDSLLPDEAIQAGADTQERPVSQLVEALRCARITVEDAMEDEGASLQDLQASRKTIALAMDALQASEEREQRLRALERDGHDVDFCKILAILDGGKP